MKDSSLYLPALKSSWKLAWQHKSLWVFGLFAAFLGQLGMMDLIGKVFTASRKASIGALIPRGWGLPLSEMFSQMRAEQWMLMIWISFFFIGAAILLIFAATVSQGALVHAAAQYFKKMRGLPHAGASWHAGLDHFWKLFFLNLGKKVVLSLIALWIGIMSITMLGSGSALDRLSFVVLFALAAFVGLMLSFIVIYAAGYIVVEEYPFWRAVDEAFKLFWRHWAVSLEIGLVVLFLNILLMVVAIAGVYIFFVPSALAWFMGVLLQSQLIASLGLALGISLFVLFIMFIGSIFSVFTISLWTYLFMKMHRHGATSRVLGWLSRI